MTFEWQSLPSSEVCCVSFLMCVFVVCRRLTRRHQQSVCYSFGTMAAWRVPEFPPHTPGWRSTGTDGLSPWLHTSSPLWSGTKPNKFRLLQHVETDQFMAKTYVRGSSLSGKHHVLTLGEGGLRGFVWSQSAYFIFCQTLPVKSVLAENRFVKLWLSPHAKTVLV